MNKIKFLKIISLILGLIVLGFFIYSIINFAVLENQLNDNLQGQVDRYGLIAVFLLAFILEVIPQPFVSSIVPFANGLLFGLDFTGLLIVTLLAIIFSSFTAYFLGIYFGKRLTVRLIGQDNYEKTYEMFRLYGKQGMVILALTPIPYFPILGGVFKMKPYDFVLYAVIPRIAHIIIFSYLVLWIL